MWRHSRFHQVVMTVTVSSEMVPETSATVSEALPSMVSATLSNAGVAAFAFAPGGNDGDGLVRDGVRDVGDGVAGAAFGEVADGLCQMLVWRYSRFHRVVMKATV